MKRSCESDLASANGSVRRIRFGCSQLGAASMCVKQPALEPSKTSSANHFVRGAHHRRCAREGLTGHMMPYVQGKLQADWAGGWCPDWSLRRSAPLRFIRFTPFITAEPQRNAELHREFQLRYYGAEARLTFAAESIANADCGANHRFSAQANFR